MFFVIDCNSSATVFKATWFKATKSYKESKATGFRVKGSRAPTGSKATYRLQSHIQASKPQGSEATGLQKRRLQNHRAAKPQGSKATGLHTHRAPSPLGTKHSGL